MDAVVSRLMKHPRISEVQAYQDYVDFYWRSLPYSDKFVVASFEAVTSDFGIVIEQLNKRFGTDFDQFNHSNVNERKILDRIAEIDAGLGDGDPGNFSVPTAEKERRKGALRRRLVASVGGSLRERSEGIYEKYRNIAFERAPQQKCGAGWFG